MDLDYTAFVKKFELQPGDRCLFVVDEKQVDQATVRRLGATLKQNLGVQAVFIMVKDVEGVRMFALPEGGSDA